MSNKDKIKPKGRPKASSFRKLSKSVTVKFSKPDYDRLCLRSRKASGALAEYRRASASNAQIVAKHSPEEIATMRNLIGMANNLNQLTKLSHQIGLYRTTNIVTELLQKLKAIMHEYKT